MYELHTLGRVDLRDATDGRVLQSILAQPKRLALLTYLSAGGAERFHRRDTLLATFWPESTERQARHALSQSIYFLRQRLGADALLTRGEEEVAVADRVWCDAATFDALLDAGDAEAALALYQGEMLPGFHLEDSQEFDRWLVTERERLRKRAVDAARALAERLERDGNAVGATRWLQRAASWAPFDEPLARQLIALLDRLGDRAGALVELDALALRLGRDLELEPSEETRALGETIRATRPATARPPSDAEPPPAAVTPIPGRMLRPRRIALGALGAVGFILLLGIFVWQARGRPASADTAFQRVAVLPFDVRGSEQLEYLAEGMALMLSAKLDGAGTLRVVDPRAILTFAAERDERPDADFGRDVARRFHAQQFVLGSVVEAGGRLFLQIGLYDERGVLQAEASVDAQSEAAIFAMVDDLTRELIARRHGSEGDRLTRLAALTTESLPALKAYLEGERAYRAGRFAEATGAFERAALADSTFALAHYRLSLASLWADVPDTLPFDAEARALRHAQRLSDHDRQLLIAYVAWRRGDADEAERLYRNVIALYPDDLEAWQQLGETLFHYNPLRGRPLEEARPPFEHVVRLDPSSWSAHWHLLLLDASADRMESFVERAARLRSLDPDRARETQLDMLLAFARPAAVTPARLDRLRALHALQLHELAWRVGVHLRDPASALRIARLAISPDRPAAERIPPHDDVAMLQLALGQDASAHATLSAASAIEPRALELERRAFALTLPARAPRRSDLETLRSRILAYDAPPHTAQLSYALGWIALALADTTAALAHASDIDRAGRAEAQFDFYHPWAETLRAAVAYRAGRFEETVDAIAAAPGRRWFGWASTAPDNSGAAARWLRAEALRELGRDDEALAWYATFGEHALHDLALLAPSHLRRAEIHERRGEAEAAVVHYTRVVELWRNADAELQPVVAHARARIAALTAER